MSLFSPDENLNHSCFCVSLDNNALQQALASEAGVPGLFELIQERCPYLFSTRPVFISAAQRLRMQSVIRAIESVIVMPAFQASVLSNGSIISQHNANQAKGVFFGYDFHIHNHQLGLIEINTNAGGALLNAVLARAQRACCAEVESMVPALPDILALEDNIVAMFRNEFAQSGNNAPLRTIAIIDENPEQQFLYAEFLLFKQLFERHGLQAIITDPAQLTLHDGGLWHTDNSGHATAINLVYNRLTDFTLAAPANRVLQEAYLQNAVTLTPHPRAHALYADKRNLALLTNPAFLQDIGVDSDTQQLLLENIPHTEIVNAADAERLWSQRKNLFFKPWSGYGSKAAYRGNKITQRVWQEILQGNYVAQAIVAPGERMISSEPQAQVLKFDLRNYVYNGEVQWIASRLYQGQTTNFRTPGGGFAPVFSAG